MKPKSWSLVIIALVLLACSLPVNVLETGKNIEPTESFPSLPEFPSATIPVCPTCPPPPPSSTPMIVTETEIPSPTITVVTQEPTATSTPSAAVASIRYAVMPDSPFYLQNYAHPEKGCQWMGVAGQVLSSTGVPQNDLVIVVEGTLNNRPVESLALTGLSSQYGLGGYEVELSNQVIASQGTLTLTLYDVNGIVLAYPVSFDTIADCEKNLVLITFQQVPNP